MTIGEFKAFLDGMGVGDAPTPEQWARIRERIDTLEPLRLDWTTRPAMFRTGYPDTISSQSFYPPYWHAVNGTRVHDPVSGHDLGPSD